MYVVTHHLLNANFFQLTVFKFMQISYFINQYPKVNPSYIPGEISLVEHPSLDGKQIGLHVWDGDLETSKLVKLYRGIQYVND